jgi:hypothetical protein
MIDFRYHIVSLVSVFLALAVGIVLGAGPLRDDIGSQLSGQVEQLRTETEDLRSQVDAGEARAADANGWITATGPALVDETLTGQDVALVVADETLAQTTQQVTDLVRAAGGDVTLSVRLSPVMWETDGEQARTAASDAIRAIDPALLEAGPGDAPADTDRMAAALARVLPQDAGTERRTAVLAALSDASLATVSGDAEAGATSVLVLAGDPAPVEDAVAPEVAADIAGQRQDALAAMLTVLIEDEVPTVVAGTLADATREEGLVRSVRRGGDLGDVSTVDSIEQPEGLVTAVLALAEQTVGESGSYGLADGAADRLPDLAELSELLDAAGGDGSGPTDGTEPADAEGAALPTAPAGGPAAPGEEEAA